MWIWRMAFAAALLMGSSAASHSQSTLASGSSWVNELGSILTINNIASNGQMTGTYVTKVGCSAGTQQPMIGWYYSGSSGGGAITFSVYWNGCGSVTSWSGQYNTSNGTFKALWYLTLAGQPVWNGVNAGSDTFTPIDMAKK
jgi:hypothetical protein